MYIWATSTDRPPIACLTRFRADTNKRAGRQVDQVGPTYLGLGDLFVSHKTYYIREHIQYIMYNMYTVHARRSTGHISNSAAAALPSCLFLYYPVAKRRVYTYDIVIM